MAISIVDRYLCHLAQHNIKTPALISLGVICIFLAAKINEKPVQQLDLIIESVYFRSKKDNWKQQLIDLEESIIKALQFDLNKPTLINFLDRYLRIYGLDQRDKE